MRDIYSKLSRFDIDSEVYELTISMLKQKDEQKYQSLLEFCFHKIETYFENYKTPKSYFVHFNRLVLFMQVVDDEKYKERFIRILIDNCDGLMSIK